MEREPVECKTLVSIGYDAERRILEIEFPTEAVYQYYDVPPELHAWLMRVPDKLGVFRRKVEGSFEYRRVGPAPPPPQDLEAALRASLEQGGPAGDEPD